MSGPIALSVAISAVAAAPGLVALTRRVGARLAVPLVGAGGIVLLLSALALGRTLGIPIVAASIAAAVIAAASGAGMLVAQRSRAAVLPRPDRAEAVLWISAGVAPVLWLLLLAVRAIAGAPALAWAMSGDTINNLQQAGTMVEHGGVGTSSDVSTVPLPQALIVPALAAIDRGAGGFGQVAEQLDTVVVTWAVLVAVCSLLAGVVVAAETAPGLRRTVCAVAGSLLPLGGWIAGIAFGWGFFNSTLSIAALLASWLVARSAARHPAAAFCAQLLCATVSLATWTPLAAVPGVLLVLQALGLLRRGARPVAGIRLIAGLIAVGQFLVWTAILLIPSLLLVGGTFGVEGLGVPSPWIPFVVLVVAVLAVAAAGARADRTRSLTAAVVVIVLVAITAFVFVFADSPDRWSAYYPTKLAWLSSAALLVLLGALAAPLGRTVPARSASAVVVAAALIAAVVLPGGSAAAVLRRQAPAQALGTVWHDGDAAAERILRLVPGDRQRVLWRSSDPDEAMIDFWLLAFRAGTLDERRRLPLREVAYTGWKAFREGRPVTRPIADLCTVVENAHAPVTVITADDGLAAQLDRACPDPDTVVRRG